MASHGYAEVKNLDVAAIDIRTRTTLKIKGCIPDFVLLASRFLSGGWCLMCCHTYTTSTRSIRSPNRAGFFELQTINFPSVFGRLVDWQIDHSIGRFEPQQQLQLGVLQQRRVVNTSISSREIRRVHDNNRIKKSNIKVTKTTNRLLLLRT